MAWMGASRSPIGIDVSGRFMNAVQLTRHGRGWRIDAASSVPRSDAAMPLTVEELSRLASMLYRQGFRGGGIVMAVPTERLVTGMLELADGGVPETRRRLADRKSVV